MSYHHYTKPNTAEKLCPDIQKAHTLVSGSNVLRMRMLVLNQQVLLKLEIDYANQY